jgi:hypothetical protein
VDIEDFVGSIKSNPSESIDYLSWNEYENWHKNTWTCFEKLCSIINLERMSIKSKDIIASILERLIFVAIDNEKTFPTYLDIDQINICLRELSLNLGKINASPGTNDGWYEYGLLGKLLEILSYCNHPDSLKTLLLFVEPNVLKITPHYHRANAVEKSLQIIKQILVQGSDLHHDQEEGEKKIISEDIKDIVAKTMVEGHLREEIIELMCKCGNAVYDLDYPDNYERATDCCSCSGTIGLGIYAYCESCSMGFCHKCKILSKFSENRRLALEIIRYINDKKLIEFILSFLESNDSHEVYTVLQILNDHWEEEYIDIFSSIVENEGNIDVRNYAIGTLGERGNEEHVELLISQLEIYSKMSGKGFLSMRENTESALVDLRKHSKDYIFRRLYTEDHPSKGFKNSMNRVLRIIKDLDKPRSDEIWISELYKWRDEIFNHSNLEYKFQILSDRHINNIYKRQPETYEELMDFDIGAFKVDKYGSDILKIIRNNLPSIADNEVEIGPWKLKLEILSFLKSELIIIEESEPNSMKEAGAHTKRQLRKITKEHLENNFEEIVEDDVILKILDMVIIHMETQNDLIIGGKGAGMRYALRSRN